MPLTPRYLITSADERTWKFDQPVIFLGEWCRLYNRRHIWSEMDAIVAAPYGLSKEQKDADYTEARVLEEKIFPELCRILNRHHGTKHGIRFWSIVLGHWFQRYVVVLLNRVKTLEQSLHQYEIAGMTAYANDDYTLATTDLISSMWAFNDDRWNSELYVRILRLFEGEKCPVALVVRDESTSFSFNVFETRTTIVRNIIKWGYQRIGKLLNCLMRDNDAFIINSYLPWKEEKMLELVLGQFPQLWVSTKHEIVNKTDRELRKVLTNQLVSRSNTDLENILTAMAFELLPVCYLEGFYDLKNKVNQLPWPKKPKFIFTSNDFDFNELFKLWVAEKIDSNSTYIVGQHGANYGTYRYLNPSIEEITADRFLTWGWVDGLSQHTPAYIFKVAAQKIERYNPKGGLLLIELHQGLLMNTWDSIAEYNNYFEDQKTFVSQLSVIIKKLLTIRLYHSHVYLKWDDEKRWKEFDSSLKIDTGESEIFALVSKNRLVVHSYDSTGILEMFSQNIPTLVFFQNGLDHLRDSAKPYYQLLVDAGILYLTPESVAEKANEIWDNVNGWWMQNNVQEARRKFCNQYARQSQYPIRELKKIFEDI